MTRDEAAQEIRRQELLCRTRRHFFADCGIGLGKVALAGLLSGSAVSRASEATAPASGPHFAPRARRVIHLFMAGAPSQLDLFDPKPELTRYDGQPIPPEVVGDQRYAFIRRDATVLAPRFPFEPRGESGAMISSVLPHLAEVADDLAFIKSVHTDQFNHAPAQLFLNSGFPRPGRPSIGSWVTYGLGSETDALPSFVVLSSGGGTSGGVANWSSGFLPQEYAGVPFRSQGDPIINVGSPAGVDSESQSASVEAIQALNGHRYRRLEDPRIEARIRSYELAHRMQTSAPELMDFTQETAATMEDYGAEPGEASFANNCLLARRLLERGVRFVNIYHKGWDHHSNVEGGLQRQCGLTDRPIAALIRDLKRLGMLEDTLVVWSGEFGRTPMVESNPTLGRKLGRDHHPQAFTVWMAGGGIRAGTSLGRTDDLGFHVVKDPVHVHDLQATILHLLGLDHERLTYRFQGRDFRLTDVHGRVVHDILL